MKDNEQQSIDRVETIEDQTEGHHEHHHHSEHAHGHGHHRRHHHRGSSSKKNKFVSFLKKNRGILINILSCTVSAVLLFVMALNMDFSKPSEAESHYTDITQSTVRIETSIYPEEIPLVSDAISYYLKPDNDMSATEVYKAFGGDKCGLNTGLPVNFTYRVTGLPVGMEVQSAVLEVSEYDDYRDARTYNLNLDVSVLEMYMLKTGTKYFYRVNLTLDNGDIIGTTGSFETEASPRILAIDGAVNVRDIGGWKAADGRIVKQGLLYRGSEIDGAVQPEYKITDRSLQQMTGELGIRFDMDLRSPSVNQEGTNALGKNVVHKYYGVDVYSAILNNKEKLREIFSDLAKPENYPIYLHCTYGRDRTGSVCYLLEALLGFSDSDLRKEYNLSAFTDSYVNTPEFNAFTESISALNGNTTQQKVEGYLLSIGVTAEEIETIREIFLEG